MNTQFRGEYTNLSFSCIIKSVSCFSNLLITTQHTNTLYKKKTKTTYCKNMMPKYYVIRANGVTETGNFPKLGTLFKSGMLQFLPFDPTTETNQITPKASDGKQEMDDGDDDVDKSEDDDEDESEDDDESSYCVYIDEEGQLNNSPLNEIGTHIYTSCGGCLFPGDALHGNVVFGRISGDGEQIPLEESMLKHLKQAVAKHQLHSL